MALASMLLLVSGCTTTQDRVLGDGVTISPGWERLKQTSSKALCNPNVWAPLLGAALLQVNNVDKKLADSLHKNTPIFGSAKNANDASDQLRSVTTLAYVSTALMAPGPDDPSKWLSTKTKLVGSEWMTAKATGAVTAQLKSVSRRERPNGPDDASFPSGHAASASVQAQMAKFNLEYLPIDESSANALGITLDGFSAFTGWARVEAGLHYPSDVLAGWALGYFVAQLAQDFIDQDKQQVVIAPKLTTDGGGVQLMIKF